MSPVTLIWDPPKPNTAGILFAKKQGRGIHDVGFWPLNVLIWLVVLLSAKNVLLNRRLEKVQLRILSVYGMTS